MNKQDKKRIKNDAREWLSKKIDLDDIAPYHILVEKGQVKFWKFKEELQKYDIYKIANRSKEVDEAHFSPRGSMDYNYNFLYVSYKNGEDEIIHKDEVIKRKWFNDSLEEIKRRKILNLKMGTHTFATYNIIFPYHSKIYWQTLEKVARKSFEFEKAFKKPKNKLYAKITI